MFEPVLGATSAAGATGSAANAARSAPSCVGVLESPNAKGVHSEATVDLSGLTGATVVVSSAGRIGNVRRDMATVSVTVVPAAAWVATSGCEASGASG